MSSLETQIELLNNEGLTLRIRPTEAQQRGEKGTAEILSALMEGVDVDDAAPIYVVDLLGNRREFNVLNRP